MQKIINKYFNKLCSDKFFKNDDENIIGKARDVIDNLKEQCEYVKIPTNNVEEDIEFITSEAQELIKQIKNTYSDESDVIWLSFHPMVNFYVLMNKKSLLEELKDYYDELEEK